MRRPGARIEEVLRLVDLWDVRRARTSTYSGGMKRRLALARSLLHDPSVLILDEPTLGVDIHGRRALWDRIAEKPGEIAVPESHLRLPRSGWPSTAEIQAEQTESTRDTSSHSLPDNSPNL